ncbi:Transcriptional regulator, LysR family [hydrothermal vent metagenome]|uniref:Transcriptional regulator, LysR family n=1 Tax=hydrothermal vent metagenome TaxID=652676 RepID=A0A3B0RQS7_9ZZZZ
MDNWDEVRTAYYVAKIGTVSGAAEVLGVHHATVIRHIDAIEMRLGVRLFQRHARGYSPTEAGEDLLRVAQTTDDQLSQLSGRIKGRGDAVTGELIVTSLGSLNYLLVPVLTAFQEEYPDLVVRYLTGDRLFRLEYGEAHVAIRAGRAPDQPDNVVQPFFQQQLALYASEEYVAQHGQSRGKDDYANHRFVGVDGENSRSPYSKWMREQVPVKNIIFRSGDVHAIREAVMQGAGIGFLPVVLAQKLPGLIEMQPPEEAWTASLWLVTHRDLHRTNKVQAFLTFLKEQAKGWASE